MPSSRESSVQQPQLRRACFFALLQRMQQQQSRLRRGLTGLLLSTRLPSPIVVSFVRVEVQRSGCTRVGVCSKRLSMQRLRRQNLACVFKALHKDGELFGFATAGSSCSGPNYSEGAADVLYKGKKLPLFLFRLLACCFASFQHMRLASRQGKFYPSSSIHDISVCITVLFVWVPAHLTIFFLPWGVILKASP